MNTFVEDLNRLNAQGFLRGLVDVGSAVKEQKQNSTLVDLYNQYKVKSGNLLNTTDQQIGDINAQASKQGNQNDPLVDAANMSTKFAMAAFNSLNRIKQLNELSGSIVPIMMTLGEDGVRMAQSISREIDQFKSTEESKVKIPLMKLDYENAMLSQYKTKQDMDLNNIKMDELKKDISAQDMLANFTKVDSINKSIFQQLPMLDKSTGRTNFDIKQLYKEAYNIYGKLPSGEVNPAFNNAWLLLNDYVKNHLQIYDSSDTLRAQLAASQSMNEKIIGFANVYENATSMADVYAKLTNDPSTSDIRRAYYNAAGVTPTANPNDIQLGSDMRVIEKMEDGYAKEQMKWINKHFFDKTNKEDFYWDYLDMIEGQLSAGQGKKVALKQDMVLNIGGMRLPAKRLILNTYGFHNPAWLSPEQGARQHYSNNVKEAEKNVVKRTNDEKKLSEANWSIGGGEKH